MPSLHFKGKSAVWNHHLSVPYHPLERDDKRSIKGKNADENLIIEGDNLLALKSLLPKYQGRIKCIYIDPPYNTGNEGWVYSDNVNSPIIKDWLGEAVGKEGEDLTRHDKWLCMITPRLKLLRELLSDDGMIFVSIDDNEVNALKLLMDEVFGPENFLAQMTWRGMHTVRNSSKEFNKNTEFILVYANNKRSLIEDGNPDSYIRLPTDKSGSYPHDDNDGNGPYKLDPLHARNFYTPYTYTFKNGIAWKAPAGRFPCYSIETLSSMEEANEIDFSGKEPKAKRYLRRVQEGVPPDTLLPSQLVGFSKDGTAALEEIFSEHKVFDQPKPPALIKFLLSLGRKMDQGKDAIILDSFAGSGTTGQAVMELNAEDGGKRKFILIQLPEEIKENTPAYEAGFRFVHEITRERVKRVIGRNKYDVGFTYYTLGPSIDAERLLSGELPTFPEFARYVYYLATGKDHAKEKEIDPERYYVGSDGDRAVYLLYRQDMEQLKSLAITLSWVEEVHKKHKGRKTVYAPACYLDDEHLSAFNIEFVSIPYNLFERAK